MSILLQDAFAQAAQQAGPQQGSLMGSVIMMAVFVLVFYFLLWRPQSKRAKEHRQLMTNLAIGDEVVTAGGILGTVSRIAEGFVALNVAEGIELKLQKSSIAAVMPKGTLKSV